MRSADGRATPTVIRDESLRLFADRGPDAVTIRDVARAAGVSAALVMHHFGSKAGLRQAVDEHVIHVLEGILDALPADRGGVSLVEAVVRRLPDDSPVPGYLRRLLLAGDPAGMRVFAQWFQLARAERAGDPAAQGRADLVVLGDLGRLLLRDHLAVVLGTDPLGPAASRWWTDGAAAALGGPDPAAPEAT